MEDVKWIHSNLPSKKQILAFSKYYSEVLSKQILGFMKETQHVVLSDEKSSIQTINMYYIQTPKFEEKEKMWSNKWMALLKLLSQLKFELCAIYCNDEGFHSFLIDQLNSVGKWSSLSLVGTTLSPDKKSELIKSVIARTVQILLLTDTVVFDVERYFNLIINIDVPLEIESLTNRVGRTGRFGYYGVAVTIGDAEEIKKVDNICRNYTVQHQQIQIDDSSSTITPSPSDIYSINPPSNTYSQLTQQPSGPSNNQEGSGSGTNTRANSPSFHPVRSENLKSSKGDSSGHSISPIGPDVTSSSSTTISTTSTNTSKMNPTQRIVYTGIVVSDKDMKTYTDIAKSARTIKHLMETESWTHPRQQDISKKIFSWRKEVYAALKEKSTSLASIPSIPEVSSSDPNSTQTTPTTPTLDSTNNSATQIPTLLNPPPVDDLRDYDTPDQMMGHSPDPRKRVKNSSSTTSTPNRFISVHSDGGGKTSPPKSLPVKKRPRSKDETGEESEPNLTIDFGVIKDYTKKRKN
eukprot:TRINITY_DN2466_c0_g1_i3.p1 TRINITY_DN2466_c0_g1~~TRINITY_DN2466_c0_g1_i3.p1  ORF type:complete len:520 (-),score=98.92 TRINITY_DN2466_c0_g1_i3:32-1591(-)